MAEQTINNASQHFNNPDRFEKMFIWLFDELAKKYPDKTLPSEIQREIFRLAGGDTTYVYAGKSPAPAFTAESPKAMLKFVPPPKGASPFMKLPTELRRQIFAESLPQRDVLLHPKCDSDPASHKDSKNGGFFLNPKPRPNNVSNLMVINKKICEEVAEMMYEERTFVLHVHEGLVNGGVEFLTTGLQPLQYLNLDVLEDNRFDLKFGRNQFSFRRLKKIVVQIHPTTENEFRHTAVNTHFIVKALCRLLDRGDGDTEKKENRITRLEVEFVKPKASAQGITGRRAIMREQYWWDPLLKQPRTTSIHDLSNIELVLRPFEMLACHSVHIRLPDNLYRHQPTVDFVSRLKKTMTSTDVMDRYVDDDVERKIEVLRTEMEEYVTYTAHGKGFHSVENLTATDMQDGEEKDDGYDSAIDSGSTSDDDSMDWVDNSGSRVKQTIGERRSQQKAILKSLESAQAEEDALMARAIAASMEDFQPSQSSSAGSVLLGMSCSIDTEAVQEHYPAAFTDASYTYPGISGAGQSKGSSPDDPIDVDDDDDDVEMPDAADALSNLRRVYSDY